MSSSASPSPNVIGFIGGGNMASALIGGLVKAGRPPASIVVVEPIEAQRARLVQAFGVAPIEAAGPALAGAATDGTSDAHDPSQPPAMPS